MYPEYERFQRQSKTPGTALVRCGLIQNYALPIIGEMHFEQPSASNIISIYKSMEDQGLKSNTIYGMQAALSSYFKYARQRGYTGSDPMSVTPRRYNTIR